MDHRFKYHQTGEEEELVTNYQRYTVDKGLQSAQAATFVVEGREDAFIDPTQCYLKTTFRVLKENGDVLTGNPNVFPTGNYSANLWSQVSISLNNTVLPPGNDYPYSALLIDLLGSDPDVRDGVLIPLAGWGNAHHGTSKVDVALASEEPGDLEDMPALTKASKEVVVYQRVHSDFLMSCSQPLPNRMQLVVTLTRGKDAFVLCRGADKADKDYKVDITSVSLFVKRIQPSPARLASLNAALQQGGTLQYQRLQTLVFSCAKGSLNWSWHNCFHNILPRRVFVALVSQEAYFGSYNRISNYLESVSLKSARFCRDGRDILPEPYTFDFKYLDSGQVDWQNSDGKAAFHGLNQTIGTFANPRHRVGIRYNDFVDGATVLAASMDHSLSHRPAHGSLDIHLEFGKETAEPMMVLVMGEFPKTLTFDSDRNLT